MAATFIIKMPRSTTTIFVSLNVRFVNFKSLLRINGWAYILFSTVGTCYQIDNMATITWKITFNEISLTCDCTSKLTICNQKVLTNVTCLFDLHISGRALLYVSLVNFLHYYCLCVNQLYRKNILKKSKFCDIYRSTLN